MSRQDGPVHQSGMPADQASGGPDATSNPYQDPFAQYPAAPHPGASGPGGAQPAQAAPQQNHGVDVNGGNGAQAPQQQAGGYTYAQQPNAPQYQDPQSYTAPQPDPAQTYGVQSNDPAAGLQNPASSWADVNQPVTGNPGPTYEQPAVSPYPQTDPQAQPTASGLGHVPSGQPAHYQDPAPHMAPTTPTAAPSGYAFSNPEFAQAASSYPAPAPQGHDPHLDWGQSGYAPAAGQATDPNFDGAVAGQSALHEDGFAHPDEEFDEDHDAPRGRKMFIAAALAGAIVVGGSMAYGYQALFGAAPSGKPPVVRGAAGPSKVKPADPGGRQFAHKDSKIMGRLGAASGATNDPASGARRVSTLRIGRDGSVLTPASPNAAPSGSRMVSGTPLGGAEVAANSPAKPVQAAPAKAKAAAPLVVKPPPQKANPIKVGAVNPAKPKPPTKKPVVVNSQPAQKPPVVTTKAKPKPALKKIAAAKPAPVATGPKPTGAGYVAVLASVPASKNSRMNALKQFADMQQKYGSALANKTPDVQRADLGAKGTYHRLIAGPPGSVQSARATCAALKSSGYSSCWVLAY